jgi:hypothetical protein
MRQLPEELKNRHKSQKQELLKEGHCWNHNFRIKKHLLKRLLEEEDFN